MKKPLISIIKKQIETKQADQRTKWLTGAKKVLIDKTIDEGRRDLIDALVLEEGISFLKKQLREIEE